MPHCHDGRDEECAITNLRGKDNHEARAKSIDKAGEPAFHDSAAGLRGAVLSCRVAVCAHERGAEGASSDDELAKLATLPPPAEGEQEPLSLFDPEASSSDATDDFLIDEVFSAM